MDIPNIPDILQYGLLGFSTILLFLVFREIRSQRQDTIDLIKVLILVKPEAAIALSTRLKRQIQGMKFQAEETPVPRDAL